MRRQSLEKTRARKKKREWISAGAALFFILIFIHSPALAGSPDKGSYEKLKRDISQKRARLRILRDHLRFEKYRLSIVNEREQEISRQLHKTENALLETRETLDHICVRQRQVKIQLEAVIGSLEKAKKRLRRYQGLLERRLREIYEAGELGCVEALMTAQDFSDFLNRAEYLQRVVKGDLDLIKEVRSQKQDYERQQNLFEQKMEELRQLQASFEEKEDYYDSLRKKCTGLLDEVELQRKKISNNIYEIEELSREEETRLQEMIREAQRINRKSNLAYTGGGTFIWPVPGWISSGFGWRTHPIRGTLLFHSGIDIAADYGVPVLAAAPGVVIFAGWYGGYGNAVIIDHGGGYSTLYAHCQALYVVEGQHIVQRQPVAAVGSTGVSTGPHLHFEVRQNGVPIDPRGKL